MSRRLHEQVCLVRLAILVIAITTGLLVSAMAGSVGKDDIRSEIALSLPPMYADFFELTSVEANSEPIAVACASPSQSPGISGPWARVFLLKPRQHGWNIIWQKAYQGDWFCEGKPGIWDDGRGRLFITFLTRPPSGSIATFHLRVYRYMKSSSVLSPVLVVEYVDGGFALVPSQVKKAPLLLVYEPTYQDWPKYQPQKYRFRVYQPNAFGWYQLGCTVHTAKRYSHPEPAYEEVQPLLQKVIEEGYFLPKALPGKDKG